MNRRSFLKGALVLTATTVLPLQALSRLSPLPTIYGDGINDDTLGLQAMLDGLPFRIADGFTGIADDGFIADGTFLLSSTLHFNRHDRCLRFYITNCNFTLTADVSPVFQFHHDTRFDMRRIGFSGLNYTTPYPTLRRSF